MMMSVGFLENILKFNLILIFPKSQINFCGLY